MNWDQFKDPVCYLCLAGAAVASWSLRQEVAGSSPFNDKKTEFAVYSEVSTMLNLSVRGSNSLGIGRGGEI